MNSDRTLYRLITSTAASGLLIAVGVVWAEEAPKKDRPIDGIMDNSFLVEEAYNQEPGVVQHILTMFYNFRERPGRDDHLWSLNFTQEWPVFSQRHQFSYSVPYYFVESGGRGANGVGDVLLNYRFQAWYDEESLFAFAPRASLVLPTGGRRLGFGDDTVGAQFSLPLSTTWGDRWFTHFNAGLTYLPHALSTSDRDGVHFNLGTSVIYAATRDLHLMLEWTGNWINVPDRRSGLRYEFASLISPGVRRAFNFANESQLVVGIAVPVGLTSASPDIGVFLYLSFEHSFLPRK